MPTLYVENIPRELYEALRKGAKNEHRSIAAEILALLERTYPTEKELKRRRAFVRELKKLRRVIPSLSGDGPSSTEMIREDRDSR